MSDGIEQKKWLSKLDILAKDEIVKTVIFCGAFVLIRFFRFDVLTDHRILRYKKYFGITEEITLADVKGFNYSLSLMVMTMRFDTEQGIKMFEIVMTKSLQKETASVLEQIMKEKGIPKNNQL